MSMYDQRIRTYLRKYQGKNIVYYIRDDGNAEKKRRGDSYA